MSRKICFVASEITPLAKTGGLADVAGALGCYLHTQGHDVRLFMPYYSTIDLRGQVPTAMADVQQVVVQLGSQQMAFSLYETTLPGSAVPVYLVDCPQLYARESLYTTAVDEHLRFFLFQIAVLESCQRLRFRPDIMHCNDWHTGLLPLLLRTRYAWDALFARTRTLLTIHNIGYQGVFPADTATELGLDTTPGLLDEGELSRGNVNWLRQGLLLADAVSTVSPTYAQEICTPQGGYGLDDTLRARARPAIGILNGVDYDDWNPEVDKLLSQHYSADRLDGKRKLKTELQERFGLGREGSVPLAGIVSRLTVQKGFDLLFDTLPAILDTRPMQVAVLGTGEPRYVSFFAELTRQYPGRVAFHTGYHEELAHLIEAGSDMFIMPSLYEPCGLNQMYSLKYGTVPIVRRTGGLADSVQMWDPQSSQGTGIVFNDFDAPAMRWALGTALDLYADRDAWSRIMRNGMSQDFSWKTQGREYERLYEQLIEKG
ncbi:MAG: glycogen synthase GlgA [Steroidobacteraceae bacterium]